MTMQELLSHIRKELVNRQTKLKDHLAMGRCQTLDDYRRIVGTISGLGEADQIIVEVLETLEDD